MDTKPPAGMRDFLPDQLDRRRWILSTIEKVYQRHDFRPIETPVLERLEILSGKYGEEGEQLMFKVLKRGEKLEGALAAGGSRAADLCDFGMRYDLTVPLARVVAEYQSELPRIFKCYQMRPVWRADRPAHGRFREFFQCDVDIVGTSSPLAEVDVLTAAAEALGALGFSDFSIRINDRRLLASIAAHARIPAEQHGKALTVLDKLDKIGEPGVRAEMAEAGIAGEAIEQLFGILSFADLAQSPRERLRLLAERLGASAPAEAVAGLDALLGLVAEIPRLGSAVAFDPTLVRGLTYYTGPIFEAALPGFSGSVAGGGRYDNLVGMFLGRDVPACGISLGVERLALILEERGMYPGGLARLDVFVARFPGAAPAPGLRLAALLRAAGLTVSVYPEETRLKKQYGVAEKAGARVVAVIGPDEAEAGDVGLKRMETGEQRTLPIAEAAAQIAVWLERR